jgi:hypothetical protein
MPAPSPKLFAVFVTKVTRKLALYKALNFSQVIRYRHPHQNEGGEQIGARATESALELAREFFFRSARQLRPVQHPVEHLPLALVERTAFLSPVGHGERADCVLLCKLAVCRNNLQIFFCPQFFALLENLSKHAILIVVHVVGDSHSEEALLHHVERSIP